MTLAEHDALLKAEGRYDEMVERGRKQEEEHLRRMEILAVEEQELVGELHAAGYAVKSVWDLVNTAASYPKALPILLNHISRPYSAVLRDGIARALAVPEAKCGWTSLVRLYREENELRVKDALAVAISVISDDDVIGELIALARDPRHGPSRLLLLSALERSRDKRARMALMALGADPQLYKEIEVILRRLKRRKR